MENYLTDAPNCLYSEPDDVVCAGYIANGQFKINLSLIKQVPTPRLNQYAEVVNSDFQLMRMGSVDLNLEQAQNLAETLNHILHQYGVK